MSRNWSSCWTRPRKSRLRMWCCIRGRIIRSQWERWRLRNWGYMPLREKPCVTSSSFSAFSAPTQSKNSSFSSIPPSATVAKQPCSPSVSCPKTVCLTLDPEVAERLVKKQALPGLITQLGDEKEGMRSTTALCCRNIYLARPSVQRQFLQLGGAKPLVELLQSKDNMTVFETILNLFDLVLVSAI